MQHHIILDSETDFDGWRKAARALVVSGITPADVSWSVRGAEPGLFEAQATTPPPDAPSASFNVPARFVELARIAILHRDSERFALLYRLLWRLLTHHDLLDIATDPDVARIGGMARAVRHDEHKRHAFVRFREVGRESKAHYVAWFEPEHHIVELAAPFFARRFADMPWSIACVAMWKIGPECVAQQAKCVRAIAANCGDRSAWATVNSRPSAAGPPRASIDAGGRRTSRAAGMMSSHARSPITSIAVRHP